MLVLENSVAQCGHHDANCPACVALQLDDLICTVNSSRQTSYTHETQASLALVRIYTTYGVRHLDTYFVLRAGAAIGRWTRDRQVTGSNPAFT